MYGPYSPLLPHRCAICDGNITLYLLQLPLNEQPSYYRIVFSLHIQETYVPDRVILSHALYFGNPFLIADAAQNLNLA